MRRKAIKWILLGLFAAVSIVWLMADHDYMALAAGRKPSFTPLVSHLGDGGTVEYYGFGYTVSLMHSEMMSPTGTIYQVGPRLSYWLLGVGRDGTRIKHEQE